MRIVAGQRPSRLAILGHPVAHSLSPVFQNAALTACELALEYARFDVSAEHLSAALETCRETRTGGNVTIPHKEAVAAACVRLSDVARRAGAVNTFWFEDGALCGHNTDVDGAQATIMALRGALDNSARRHSSQHGAAQRAAVDDAARAHAVLLGSGGSAAAVLLALARFERYHITIVARTTDRASALLSRTGVAGAVLPFGSEAARAALGAADLIVNSTSLGLHDEDPLPADPAVFGKNAAVFDLVYRPAHHRKSESGTPWVRAARARGLVAEDGLRMLVEQGAAAFETWFGITAPRRVMWDALGVPMPPPDEVRP